MIQQKEYYLLIFWMTSKTLTSINFKLEHCDVRLRLVDDIYNLFGGVTNVVSPVFAIRAISFSVKISTFPPQSVFMSCMNQRLFPYTAFTDWFL
jgi:hypothetical protein